MLLKLDLLLILFLKTNSPVSSKCFFSTAIEGKRGKHKKGRYSLDLCTVSNFLFSLNTWDFIFKTSSLNWKNRLKSYWRRNPDISLSSVPCKFYHPGKQVLVTAVQEPTGAFYTELVRISFGKAGHRPHLALINSLY